MKLTKEQFIELVISLEHRNLTLGWELSSDVDLDEVQDELPAAVVKKVAEFEKLQHELYTTASEHGLEDQFEMHEDTGFLVIKIDSSLEKIVWNSIEKMEEIVTSEMVVRHKVIELSQIIRNETAPKEPTPEEMFPRIEALSKTYWKQLKEKGLTGLIKEL